MNKWYLDEVVTNKKVGPCVLFFSVEFDLTGVKARMDPFSPVVVVSLCQGTEVLEYQVFSRDANMGVWISLHDTPGLQFKASFKNEIGGQQQCSVDLFFLTPQPQ